MQGPRRLLRLREEFEAGGVPPLAEYRGHQSLRRLVNEGYQLITF